MPHSLDLGIEAGVNSRLTELRLFERGRERQANDQHVVPGIFFNSDPEGKVTVETELAAGKLMTAHFTVDGPARWMALHIQLGDLNLSDKMILGIALRSQAAKSLSFKLCLRSGQADGFTDTFLRKTAIAYAEPSLHLDALMLAEHPMINGPAPWRELILFFRPETSQIDLQDLRVFSL